MPYATLDPLQAVLPVRHGDPSFPADDGGIGGIRLAGLERRMRERWQTISDLWDEHKSSVNKLDLMGQLDYWSHVSAQLEWQRNPGERPVRVLYARSGIPTAALITDDHTLVDTTLYWITCQNLQEAHYLLAIINSDTLYAAVQPLMAKGQFGARHSHKQLWKLPIPEYDATDALHVEMAEAGAAAAAGAGRELGRLRADRGNDVGVRIVRRELRRWLRESAEGAAVEGAVGRLLG